MLLATSRGRRLRGDPAGLWWHLAERMPPRSADRCETQAGLLLLAVIAAGVSDDLDAVVARLLGAIGWISGDGTRLTGSAAAAAAWDTRTVVRPFGGFSSDRHGFGPGKPTPDGIDGLCVDPVERGVQRVETDPAVPSGLLGEVRGQRRAILQICKVIDIDERDDGLTMLGDRDGTVGMPGLGDKFPKVCPSRSQRIAGHASKFTLFGFGVFQIEPGDTVEAVTTALQADYRHIDMAEMCPWAPGSRSMIEAATTPLRPDRQLSLAVVAGGHGRVSAARRNRPDQGPRARLLEDPPWHLFAPVVMPAASLSRSATAAAACRTTSVGMNTASRSRVALVASKATARAAPPTRKRSALAPRAASSPDKSSRSAGCPPAQGRLSCAVERPAGDEDATATERRR